MPSTCHARRFAALNIGELLDHVSKEIILPFRKLRAVADYLFSRQTPILSDGCKTQVHMRRFLVQMNGCGKYVAFADFLR